MLNKIIKIVCRLCCYNFVEAMTQRYEEAKSKASKRIFRHSTPSPGIQLIQGAPPLVQILFIQATVLGVRSIKALQLCYSHVTISDCLHSCCVYHLQVVSGTSSVLRDLKSCFFLVLYTNNRCMNLTHNELSRFRLCVHSLASSVKLLYESSLNRFWRSGLKVIILVRMGPA